MILPAIISFVFEVCATQPLDVIKTHHQTNTKVIFSIKELYRGFVPRALGNIPSRSIFLFSQDYLHLLTFKTPIFIDNFLISFFYYLSSLYIFFFYYMNL